MPKNNVKLSQRHNRKDSKIRNTGTLRGENENPGLSKEMGKVKRS
jgi:hypothetical protein